MARLRVLSDWNFYDLPAPDDPVAIGAKRGVQVRNAATGFNLFHQSHMPFGQHAGKILERVPAHYLLKLRDDGHKLHRRWLPVLDYIDRHLTEIQQRSQSETPPKEVSQYLYLPPDMQTCRDEWGAACGHGALAACLGIPVAETQSLFGRGGWVNIPMMQEAIRKAGFRWGNLKHWPTKGQSVVMLQILGPWMEPGIPIGARCTRRHWIAVRDLIVSDKRVIWDANAPRWQTRQQWEADVIPDLLRSYRHATGWELSSAICIWT